MSDGYDRIGFGDKVFICHITFPRGEFGTAIVAVLLYNPRELITHD